LIRNEGSNGSHKRGAYRGNETIRIVCNEILQSLVTMFTNMELEIRVKRFTRTMEVIANYVGREYSKEMRLLAKNHQNENEPKEQVIPGRLRRGKAAIHDEEVRKYTMGTKERYL
jgi:hypothetical protein